MNTEPVITAPTLLSLTEAAVALRMTSHGVRKSIKSGVIPGIRIGRRYWVHKSELDRVLMQGTAPVRPLKDAAE